MTRALAALLPALVLATACAGGTPTPLAVIESIAGGSTHTLALKSDGSVWAWGQNDRAQLGDGSITDRHTPIRVPSLRQGVAAVAAGAGFSLALKTDGSVWAWGANDRGQLGDGNNDPSLVPVRVKGLQGHVTSIAAGESFGLALRADGSVWAWGLNYAGQLGNGANADTTSAVAVTGLAKPMVRIAAGFGHSLAIDRDGSLWAWGDNSDHELGVATPGPFLNTPVKVSGLPGKVVAVAGGSFQTVAALADGSVYAWGREFAPLGGEYIGSDTPVKVDGVGDAKQVLAGWGFDLALEKNGSVWAWGEGGEVLGASAHGDTPSPIQVAGLRPDVTSIYASWYNGYALRANGTLAAWGNNNQGQLGNGTVDPEGGSLLPVAVNRF